MFSDIKIIKTKDFGDVPVTKNRRSKHIMLQIHPKKGLCVVAPRFTSMLEVESVIEKRAEWIKQKLEKVKELESKITIFDINTNFQTRHHRLVIMPHDSESVLVKVSDGIIRIKYPSARELRDSDIQKAVREGIHKALRIEAKDYIPHRVKGLAERFKLKYSDITVKDIRTRWGSCSNKNNLNFNIHIMRLPDHLIDYIIMHELAHTIERNHSRKFWSLLDTFVGHSKKIDKELKAYRIGIW
ncbi:MAG: SprT family zinc-dependent metalloprotease [bacterium]